MLNNVYYSSDNILNSIAVADDLNNVFESTDITSISDNEFQLSYNNIYPTIVDSTVDQLDNVVIDQTSITFDGNSETLVSLVLYDEYMKMCCEDLCTTSNIFKLNNFTLSIAGTVNGQYNSDAIFLHTQKNPLTDNIVYDYILNPTKGTTLYSSQLLELLPKKELIGYVSDAYLPDYTFKCIKSNGDVVYNTLYLNDLGLSPSNGLVTSTFYDVTTIDSTILSDDIFKSCKTISILLSSESFKTWFAQQRTVYKEIYIVFKIKSLDSNVIKIDNTQLYFNWYRGCKFYFIPTINNGIALANNGSWFLNRGMYLKYSSSDIESLNQDSVNFSLNDNSFIIDDSDIDKTLLTSTNYIITDNVKTYVPLQLYDTSNILSITIKDLAASVILILDKSLKMTLMRQLTSVSQNNSYYNPDNTKISINDFKYISASQRYTIINKNITSPYVSTKILNKNILEGLSVLTSDITTVLNELNSSLEVNVFWRKLSVLNSYLYIQFTKSTDINYLKKYLTTNIIDLILNNIIVSISKMDLSANKVQLSMLSPTRDYINKYSDTEGTVTYMWLINDMEILSVNGIYNKSVIESNYYVDSTSTSLYVPSDVIIIGNNLT